MPQSRNDAVKKSSRPQHAPNSGIFSMAIPGQHSLSLDRYYERGMAFADSNSIGRKERLASGGSIAGLHALALWGLITALGIDPAALAAPVDDLLKTFTVEPPEPAEEAVSQGPEPDDEEAAEEGAPSEAAEEADPTPIIAPDPPKMPSTNEVVATEKPAEGDATDAGESDVDDDGAGSGDEGIASGTGNSGTGSGAGGDGNGTGAGVRSPPRKTKGDISDKDFRKVTGFSAQPGEVTVWYTVQPNGRVTDCRVAIPSGNATRDRLTCELIEKRWRYEPARNAAGEPVASETGWKQRWWPTPGNRDDIPPELREQAPGPR